MNKLEEVLNILETGASVVSILGPLPPAITSAAKLADYFLKIAQSAVRAHESITGKPLDLNTLHAIAPVE